jgi:tetratricopeptide (TPR) repeat protein
MSYFDSIDFEEDFHEESKDKEALINAVLKGENPAPELELETIDDLINYLLEKNQHQKAIEYIDSLLDFFPYSNEIWQRKAYVYDNNGDYRNAIECFDKAITLNPLDEETLISKGITLDNSGNHEGAIKCFDDVIGIDSNNIDALFNKGLYWKKRITSKRHERFSKKSSRLTQPIKTLTTNSGTAMISSIS